MKSIIILSVTIFTAMAQAGEINCRLVVNGSATKIPLTANTDSTRILANNISPDYRVSIIIDKQRDNVDISTGNKESGSVFSGYIAEGKDVTLHQKSNGLDVSVVCGK